MSKTPKLRFKEFSGDWERKRLGKVSEIYDGTHQTPKYTDSGVKFVSVENINNIYEGNKYISEEDYNKNFKIKPQLNDIFMTRITAGEIGATAIVNREEELAYYVSVALIRPDNEQVNGLFLTKNMASKYFKKELNKRIIHVAFPKKINLGDIGECRVNLPKLEEQEKIASFFSLIDDKILLQSEKVETLKDYKKGMMQKIFSRELRFKDDEGRDYPEWEEKRIDEISDIYQPKTISQSDFTDSGYVVYGANGSIGFYSKYNHDTEQIAVTCRGNTCGTINFTPKFVWITGNAMVVNTDNYMNDVVKEYLKYILTFSDLKYLITGSGQPQITRESLITHKIKLPNIKEQQKIADFLSTIDTKIELEQKKLDKLKEYKKGLLQQMFV